MKLPSELMDGLMEIVAIMRDLTKPAPATVMLRDLLGGIHMLGPGFFIMSCEVDSPDAVGLHWTVAYEGPEGANSCALIPPVGGGDAEALCDSVSDWIWAEIADGKATVDMADCPHLDHVGTDDLSNDLEVANILLFGKSQPTGLP